MNRLLVSLTSSLICLSLGSVFFGMTFYIEWYFIIEFTILMAFAYMGLLFLRIFTKELSKILEEEE